MSDLLPFLVAAGAALVTGLIGYGIKKLAELRDSKTEGFQRGMLSLAVAASAAVRKIAQRYTDALKEASKDGKLTSEEQKQAAQMALQELRSMLSFEELAKLLGAGAVQNVEALAVAKIEEAVHAQAQVAKALSTLPKP